MESMLIRMRLENVLKVNNYDKKESKFISSLQFIGSQNLKALIGFAYVFSIYFMVIIAFLPFLKNYQPIHDFWTVVQSTISFVQHAEDLYLMWTFLKIKISVVQDYVRKQCNSGSF